MIKLSDYLDYLYREVIQARIKVDEQSVELAKKYSEHEYLKYFRVPRFTIPSVKLEIPLKIDELDAETKYNFKIDEDTYVADVNKKIEEVNLKNKFGIKLMTKQKLRVFNFTELRRDLEKKDYYYIRQVDESINKIDFIKKINVKSNDFIRPSKNAELEKKALDHILKDSLRKQLSPVSSKLKNIFIDPDTTKEADKGKVLIKLNVEMVEEGLRIVKLHDENGKEFEEIAFE